MSASTGTGTTGTVDPVGARARSTDDPRSRADDSPASAAIVGRFAPSPTGELHLGSLFAAVGSFLSARARQGRWLVRMEDLDRPREVPGARGRILRTLECFGLLSDCSVVLQSERRELYEAALTRLAQADLVYRCSCTRAELARLARGTDDEPVYPGTCRRGPVHPGRSTSLRFRVLPSSGAVHFEDRLQGVFAQDVAEAVGDFIVRRKDGLSAYQLAVVVDDAAQGITEVVRGCDLLDNTPRQILLQRALALPSLEYAHLPLITEPGGSKLAKRLRSVPLDPVQAPQQLFRVLRLLRQGPPEELLGAGVQELLDWAIAHWDPAPLRGVTSVEA